MRPPPVHFPPVHWACPGVSQKLGFGAMPTLVVWSLQAAATSATTAAAPRVDSNLRFLSLHMRFTSASGGFADADSRPAKCKPDATMRGSTCCCPDGG